MIRSGLRARFRTPLVLVLPIFLLGSTCKPVYTLVTPDPGALLDEQPVAVHAMIAKAFDASTVQVRVDGVDLIAALGLVPPFVGAGGVVMIGGDPITVADFDYDTTIPQVVPLRLELSGLPLGAHLLELEATRNNNQGQPVVLFRTADFEILTGFQQPTQALAAGGVGPAPQDLGPEGTLVHASLASPLAGAPVPLTDGGELRAGFVPAAEALGQ